MSVWQFPQATRLPEVGIGSNFNKAKRKKKATLKQQYLLIKRSRAIGGKGMI